MLWDVRKILILHRTVRPACKWDGCAKHWKVITRKMRQARVAASTCCRVLMSSIWVRANWPIQSCRPYPKHKNLPLLKTPRLHRRLKVGHRRQFPFTAGLRSHFSSSSSSSPSLQQQLTSRKKTSSRLCLSQPDPRNNCRRHWQRPTSGANLAPHCGLTGR